MDLNKIRTGVRSTTCFGIFRFVHSVKGRNTFYRNVSQLTKSTHHLFV